MPMVYPLSSAQFPMGENERFQQASWVRAAERLNAAYAQGPIPPLREFLDPADASGAYAVQALNTERWRAAGRRVSGRKVGLTAKVVQSQLGVDQPDFGVLFDDMAIADGETLDPARTIQPKAEAEIALVLARDFFAPDATASDVAEACAYACAAIEIVDSRIADWKIALADTVADNGSAAYYVLGSAPRTLKGLDLYTCGMVMEIDEALASTGVGAACLGHPLEAAAWLARTLAARGEVLRAGEVILTGALGSMVALRDGQRVEAKIGGLGSVSFTYGAAK